MSDESKERQVTRESLYDQVWAKPLRILAAEYGVSHAAVVRLCELLNVPRPAVGHWVRLRLRLSVEQPPLPPPIPGQPTTATMGPSSLRLTVLEREQPTVVVADNLTRPHPAVHLLLRQLRECKPDEHGILGIRGTDGAAFRASKATRGRALRILDALFKALEKRGHAVTASEEGNGNYRGRLRMMATVSGQKVDVSIAERLTQREHVQAKDESDFLAPRSDYVPSGNLVLCVGPSWGRPSSQRRWKDTDKRRLESMLGRIVLTFEAAAEDMTRAHQEHVRIEDAYAEDARLRAVEQARADHQKVLAADLAEMANAWIAVSRIREFLRAVEDRVSADNRTEGMNAWLAWARQHAATIDPLREPGKVAKRLEPDLVKLGLA
jgi:hypothetical protein